MSIWAVYVEFDDTEADEQTCQSLTERLAEVFPDGGVSVGLERHRGGRLSIQVASAAPDRQGARGWRRALTDVTDAATQALRDLERPTEVVDVQVTRWDEFERRLLQPVVPELITLAEAARLAGVSQQRMSQVADDNPAFPPAAVLGTTLRVKRAVEAFLAGWERRPGRRWPTSSSTGSTSSTSPTSSTSAAASGPEGDPGRTTAPPPPPAAGDTAGSGSE